jgi:ring-1,2-phenylacetyl-CoA epoxidase subunit PaaC
MEQLLQETLIALADDELILGQRASEWCGHAPIIEEDIAFANLALDEIGHAQLLYSLAAGLTGENPETFPDQMVYFRAPADFRNVQLVELPNGDWAFTMLRQYLFDATEKVRLAGLASSAYQPLAEAAAKVRKEELYHLRHTQAWVERLALGTEESHMRMQAALDEMWPYTAQLFDPLPGQAELESAGYIPTAHSLRMAWEEAVRSHLAACRLKIPETPASVLQRSEHTYHLTILVKEMQSVARENEGASW